MDADEVAEAFLTLHQSGKVRHFGVSNFTPAQFALLQSRLPFTLATNQVEISPVHQPLLLDGTLDQLQQLRIRPMAWSCPGGGRLFNDEAFQPLRNELETVARELNAEVSSRWFTHGSCACRLNRCQLLAPAKLSVSALRLLLRSWI